jgi:two-component system, OmpR family, sensor kinase
VSLRTRLTLSYISFFAVALILLHVGLYVIVRQALIGSIDSELRLAAQLLQQDFKASKGWLSAYLDGDRVVFVLNKQPPQVSDFETTNLYVQVYHQSGKLVATSPNLPEPLDLEAAPLQTALAGQSNVREVKTSRMHLRELVAPLIFHDPVKNSDVVIGAIQVARPMKETDLALRLLFYVLLGGGIVVLLTAARGGAWLTRAAFKPIDEVTRTAQSIVRAEDLSRRVPVPEAHDELQRLTVTMNDLLGRLEALFGAQRRFVADVSHELRTPLAAMQGNLEVLDRGAARDPQLLDESLADMRREVARLIRMANDLLLLAQSDAGVQLRHEPIELDSLLLEVHRELRSLANGIHLRIGEIDQVIVHGDRDRIKQALLNLGINALQHTPAGGVVMLGLARQDDNAALTVADTGAGIAADDLPHIFERFYRADRARTRNSGGAGLGLAIVQWIAEAHGGRVTAETTSGYGSRFTLLLPLTPHADQPALQFVHAEVAAR